MSKHPKTCLALIAMLVYFPTVFFGWVYLDDYLIVQEAGFYAKLSNIPESFLRSVWHPTSENYNYYRPASISVYILDAWISNTLSQDILPWIFHLTNVLLKGAVAALLFAFFRALGGTHKAAVIATLALIVHPVTAGTLGWISGQNELLLAVWILSAFITFTKAGQSPRWFVLHGLCFLLALLTKENAIALPILCSLFLFLSSGPRPTKLWLGAGLTWGLTGMAWFFMLRQGGGQSAPPTGGALLSMLHGTPYLLIYLGKLFLPVGLSTLPTPQDTAWYTWTAGALAALGTLVVLTLGFKTKPLILLGTAWFLGFLLPTFANIVPELKSSFIVRADRGYLASVGILIVLLQADWTKVAGRKVKIFTASLVCVLLALNLLHQLDYSSGMKFYQSAVQGSPRSAFAHTHLGDMYLNEKDYAHAIEQYQEAIRLNDSEPQAHNNLGVTYMRMGHDDKAAEEYKKELDRYPKNILAWGNLASIYLKHGAHQEAEAAFRKAVEINPAYKDAWRGLVHIYTFLRQEQKRSQALQMLNKAEMDMSRGI